MNKKIQSGVPLQIDGADDLQRVGSVLRFAAKDKIRIFNAEGKEFESEISSISKSSASILPLAEINAGNEYQFKLDLYPAMFKKSRFEWMLEKCTEAGVSGFYPVQSQHTPIKENYGRATEDRFKKIIISAAEQCERISIPELHGLQTLSSALSQARGQIIVAAERIDAATAKPPPFKFAGDQTSLFVGPEGGWSPEEIQLLKEHQAVFISLGRNILRAETACLAGSIIILLDNNRG